MSTSCLFRFAAATLAVLALAAPAQAESNLFKSFEASEHAQRLAGLGYPVLRVEPVLGNEVIVAYYVPKQGSLSEWDDETRLVLYRWKGGEQFEREQFVSKAGDSLKGRLAGLLVRDIDGDGQPEILVTGEPDGDLQRVGSLIYRRGSAGDRYYHIWMRNDTGAALRVTGTNQLWYSFQSHDAALTRHFETYALTQGAFVKRGEKP